MIVPMKRLTVVMLTGDRNRSLERLQDLGVLHLATGPSSDDDGVAEARKRLEMTHAATNALARVPARRRGRPAPTPDADAEAHAAPVVAEEALRLTRRLETFEHERDALEAELADFAPFGDFDPARIRALAHRGVTVRLVRAPSGWDPELPEDVVIEEYAPHRRHRHLALVGPTASVDAVDLGQGPEAAEVLPLPKHDPASLGKRLESVETETRAAWAHLARLARRKDAVERLRTAAEGQLTFAEARATMAEAGPLSLIRGYCPARAIPEVEAFAEAEGWGLLIEDIDDPAGVPIAVETPRWARSIRALFSFLGVLPGYDQVDVSVPFLVFFSLFFAMIVGDAGYGLIFLVLTEVGRWRFKQAPRTIFSLLRLLSVATVVWGALTGTWFGIAILPLPLKGLEVSWLTDPDHLILLSFVIGAVHLTVAHGWNVLRLLPSPRALAEVGWILSTWTMFFLARALVLGATFPHVLVWVLTVGVVLIAGFMTPWKALKDEWFDHAMLPLSLVSNFVDLVSYVRLFAVGVATIAVAQAFNQMAASAGAGGFVAGLLAALILFLGHTLNILLASMGVLVHGVRLNTLEFAGHLGLEWTGRPYRPFAHPQSEEERA